MPAPPWLDVAKAAGLSSGIVNFHFETKEKLLVETLKYLADEYRANWHKALAAGGPMIAAGQLSSLLFSDFNPEICSRRKLAAWCAFWAEAQSRPTYLEHCGSNDEEYSAIVLDLCKAIISEGAIPMIAELIARALDALLEGLWLDLMTMAKPYSLDDAQADDRRLPARVLSQALSSRRDIMTFSLPPEAVAWRDKAQSLRRRRTQAA